MWFQCLHRGDEVEILDQHHQVDGVEVPLAPEAPSQIGARVDCSVELRAVWAQETEVVVSDFVRQL